MKALGNPAALTHGDRYAAILLVTAPRFLATDSAIAGKVASLGFEDVTVAKDAPPPGWPADAKPLPAPSSGFHAYVLATWGGKTEAVPMPSQIVAAWDLGVAGAGGIVAPPAPPPRSKVAELGELARIATVAAAAGEVLEELWTDLGL